MAAIKQAPIATLFPTGADPYDPVLDEERYRTTSDSSTVIPVLGRTTYDEARAAALRNIEERKRREEQERAIEAAERARLEREEKERQDKARERELEEQDRARAIDEARKKQAQRLEAERERAKRVITPTKRATIAGSPPAKSDVTALSKEELRRGVELVKKLLDTKGAPGYRPKEYSDDPRRFGMLFEQAGKRATEEEEALLRQYTIKPFPTRPYEGEIFWRAYLRRIRRWGAMDKVVKQFEKDFVDPIWQSDSLRAKQEAHFWMSWVGHTAPLVGLVTLVELLDKSFSRGNLLSRGAGAVNLTDEELERLARHLLAIQAIGITREIGKNLGIVKSVLATHEYFATVAFPSLDPITQYLKLRWQLVTIWGNDPVVDKDRNVVF